MVLIAVISLHNFGPSKIYLKQAGEWIHDNLPPQKQIYTNYPQVGFYTQRPFVVLPYSYLFVIKDVLKEAKLKGYDCLVFQVNVDDALLKAQLSQWVARPIKTFRNDKGDAVLVYNLSKELS